MPIQETTMQEKQMVDSASDGRTVNNTLRRQYRVLSDEEKEAMQAVKSCGQTLLDIIESLRPEPEQTGEIDGTPVFVSTFCRELNIAAERVEEAIMWAVKHITK